jgi:hypothetical protein
VSHQLRDRVDRWSEGVFACHLHDLAERWTQFVFDPTSKRVRDPMTQGNSLSL